MTPLDTLITAAAMTHSLPINLVKAVCGVESSFNPWEMRYEPSYKWLVGDKLTMSMTERTGQMCSWGVMQIMGANAREHGYVGPFPQLCDPAIGLEYGCKYLAQLAVKYPQWPDTIASYNAGSPRKVGDVYINQGYVDKIYKLWNKFDTESQT